MSFSWSRRRAGALLALSAAVLLSGCAALRNVGSEVSSYGDWPPDRKPGSYAFERLPSQQARADDAAQLEGLARAALQQAGFTAAAEGQAPDVLVQVALRTTRSDPRYWDDPLWWRGGFGGFRQGPWSGPRWALGAQWDTWPRYEREVALLLRDRVTGRPLWEARASNDGASTGSESLIEAMFRAALMDFPRLGINPRRVVVQLQ